MKYKFDDMVVNSTTKKKPEESDRLHYIGLEHIDSGTFEISRWGADAAPIGDKLIMKKGDVLFGKRRAYQRKVAIAPFDGIFSAHGMVLRPKEDVICKEYFPFFISSNQFMDTAVRISVGGLSPTVNWKDLQKQEFELPSIEEQRVLADKLWAAYNLKEAYKKMIAATDEMVKSQFIEMFGDRYAIAKWGDILTITNGKAYKGEYQPEGRYPICGSGGLMGYGDKKLCKATTTILGRKGNINSPIYMDTEYWVVDTAFCIEVDKAILHPKYFHYWCVQFDFLQYNKQAVLPSLTKSDLLTIEISIPPMKLQERFVSILEQADKSKFEIKLAIDKIDKVIKSLLQ